MAIEFQILLQNFKTSKKVDAIKAYLFRLLGIYLVDDLVYSTILTPDKSQHGEDKWMVIFLQTKKIITSRNPLES